MTCIIVNIEVIFSKLIWTVFVSGQSRIEQVDIDGTNREVLVGGLLVPHTVAVDEKGIFRFLEFTLHFAETLSLYKMNVGCSRPRLCTVRLYWAGVNLG